jgi:hypothetical protein
MMCVCSLAIGVCFVKVVKDFSYILKQNEHLQASMPLKVWKALGHGKERDIQIVSLGCSIPIALTGMNFFHLTMEAFGRVIYNWNCALYIEFFLSS